VGNVKLMSPSHPEDAFKDSCLDVVDRIDGQALDTPERSE
jgi:hypothetical protein